MATASWMLSLSKGTPPVLVLKIFSTSATAGISAANWGE